MINPTVDDPVLKGFLSATQRRIAEFAESSGIIRVQPAAGDPPQAYLVHFDAPCYVRRPSGEIAPRQGFGLAIAFPPDYLSAPAIPAPSLLQLIEPRELWHSNARWPFVCIGRIAPGTDIVELLLRVYELITFQRKANPNEFDALNPEACRWARQHWPVGATTRLPLKSGRPAGGQP